MKKIFTLTRYSSLVRQSWDNSKIFNTALSLVLLLVIFATGCKKDNFTGEVKGVCPVVATDPTDKAVDVALDKVISVTFNTAMNPASINNATFFIKQGATTIAGVIAPTPNAAIFTFTPAAALSPFTVYTGTVTTGAKDTFGTALVSDYVWTFTTIPQVTLTSLPVAGGSTVGAGTFAQGSVVTVTATPSIGYMFTNWTKNGTIASASASYQFTIAGNTALVANFKLIPPAQFVVALSSNPAAGGITIGSGSFNTGTSVTVTATPNAGYSFVNWTNNGNIVSTTPGYQFTLLGNTTLVANFKLIAGSQFTVVLSSNPLLGGTTTGSGSYNGGASVTVTATPNPGYSFINWTENGVQASTSANYTFVLNANRTLVANFALIPTPPVLGTVVLFGAFGGNAGVTNQGINTVINNGGIGTTAASTLITGFHDGLTGDIYTETPLNVGLVKGGIFTAPPAPGTATSFAKATQALLDATVLYNSISPASKPGGTDPGAGELGGLTLPPGTYKSASGTFAITNGNLTLDAQGNPNAVWIFQTAAGLTVGIAGPAGARSVNLINGAQAGNVFWYVGSAATINAAGGGVMVGTIVASAGVTFSTAGNVVQTVLNGRAISLVASVTMVNTTINVP
jgi:Ice-binding-like/Divergent InlB B-repeat domain/Bacterial Ig-like domain